MKKSVVIVVAFSLFLLCGCTTYQEINRGYMVTAIGISKSDNVYSLIIEAVYSSDVLDKPFEKMCLSATGNSINSSFENLNFNLVKPLFFQQTGTVILENVPTEEGVAFLKSIPNFNYGVFIVKTDNLNSLFSLKTPDGILGYDIISLIKNSPKTVQDKAVYQIYQAMRNQSNLIEVSAQNEKLCLKN